MLSPLLALILLALGLVTPLSASAQPHRTAAAAGSCDASHAYPPAPDATVQINTTTPYVGEKVKVSGIHYCPDEDVDITIGGRYVGTGHTDGNGTFDPRVVVPGPAGEKQVCGIGASGLSSDRDCLTIDVRAKGTAQQPATTDGGGTAMTGVKIALLGVLALVLVVAGVAMTTLGRHRRAARI